MSSSYSLVCVVASVLVSCGCVAAEFLRMRKSREELAILGEEADDRSQAEEEARAKLENQLADLASKLELSTLERREIARTNQQLSAAVDARTAELKFAREDSAVRKDELARALAHVQSLSARPSGPDRSPELEAKLASRDEELRQRTASIESLQAELAAGRQQLATVSERCGEFERELQQRTERDRQRELHEQELEGVRSARTSEFENQLAIHDEELRLHAASMDALRGELLARQQELEVSAERCGELERELEKSAREAEALRGRASEAQSGQSARTSELERQLESHEDALRQSRSSIVSLQTELALKQELIEAAEERCGDFERELERRNRRESELANLPSPRAIELEVQLATRDEELSRRASSIESLRGELTSKQLDFDVILERCSAIEGKLQREIEHGRGLEIAMSARTEELERQLASLDEELRRRALSIEALQGELAARLRELDAADAPIREFEKQLQLYREQERERLRHENELEISRLARTNDFERQIARRDGELEQLRGEVAQLMDRGSSLSQQIEQGTRDGRERDQRILEVASRLEALNFETQRGREEAKALEAISAELMDQRISAIFEQGSRRGASVLSKSYSDHLAQGDFDFAIQVLLGESEPLSAASFTRLCQLWREEHEAWNRTSLGREVVYLWADGVHVKAGLKTQDASLLVIVASFVDGSRSVIAVESGDRASKEAWLALLRTLIGREMNVPRLIVAGEELGLWAAIDELGWDCARQHCWKHKTEQVLAALPRPRRSQALTMLRAMSNAKTRVEAKKLRERFVKRCGVRCADAGELLCDDWKQLTSVYAFPEDHWSHLRTSAVVEAPLGAIRLSCGESKPFNPTPDAEKILWKLMSGARSTFRKLSAPHLLPSIVSVRAAGQENTDERSPTRAA